MRLLATVGLARLLLAPTSSRADSDPSFGSGGVATVSVTDANFEAEPGRVATQADGKIVVATREGGGGD